MAAGSTYTPIATTTLGSTSTSVTFNSFSGYTDLVLVANILYTGAGASPTIRVNGDTGSNYSYTIVYGNGSSAASARGSNLSTTYWYYANSPSSTSNTPTPYIINFQNYANTTTYKTILGRFGGASIETAAQVCLWRSTSAITSIDFYLGGTTFASGSTFTLYGITAA